MTRACFLCISYLRGGNLQTFMPFWTCITRGDGYYSGCRNELYEIRIQCSYFSARRGVGVLHYEPAYLLVCEFKHVT